MISELPGKELLQLLPLLPQGGNCKHSNKHWCIKHNGEFYSFLGNSQLHKDAWVAEARCKIGLPATLSMLHHFCPTCRTVHI